MTDYKKFKKPVKIFMGDNSMLVRLGIGSIDVDVYIESEQNAVTLTDV